MYNSIEIHFALLNLLYGDRQTDRVMQISTCLPIHCESTKMNAESRKKQDQKKLAFFAAIQNTHATQCAKVH